MNTVEQEEIKSLKDQAKGDRDRFQNEVGKWKNLFKLSVSLFNSKELGRNGTYTYEPNDGQPVSLIVSDGKLYMKKQFSREKNAKSLLNPSGFHYEDEEQ